MRNILLSIYIFVLCTYFLFSAVVYINAEELPNSIFIPRISSAVSDDALATAINPAGLGVRKGINGYYLHTFSSKTGGDNAFFLSYSGSGFGAEFVSPGKMKFNKYTLSDGIKIIDGLYFGLGYSWFNSKDKSYDDLSSWDIGTIYRPSQYISTSFVARNLNRPIFDNRPTDRMYSLSFAFRPYTDRITFSVDSYFQEGKNIEDTRLTYGLECEPVDGIIFKGSYSSKKSYGIGFSLGFPRFRIGAYNSLNENWKSEGGVFYTQFAEERYRATLRARHQVLEVNANDLSNWKMQELIINRAKKDKAIDGIILKLNSTPYSMGDIQEIRDCIMDFRSSGKKVVCYMELAGNKDYYLATACDKVLMNPAGYLSLNGLRSEVSFYKSALDKLGIEADLYHVGKYKSASEIFTSDSMSEPYRESLNSILDDLDEQLVNQIAQALEAPSGEVRKRIDKGPYTAKEADKIGLIDGLVYKDQIKDVRQDIFGKRSVQLSGKEYGKYKYHNYNWRSSPRLAIIYASGTILPGKSLPNDLFIPEIIGSETMADAIKKAREDKSIKAIVLRIDSGGGSVFASEVIWRELMLTKGKKPLIVSMGGVAASGGYYIACPGDVILAEPGTITGSIGVVAGKFSFRSLYERIGIKKEILKRGENSDIYTSYRPFSEEQQEIVKRQIQEMYDDFVNKVADGRKMSKESVEEIAQGRVWTGKQAKEKGLVDEFGGIHQALSIAKSKAGLKPDQDMEVIILPKPVSVWQRFLYGYVSLPDIMLLSKSLTKDRTFFIMPYGVNFE